MYCNHDRCMRSSIDPSRDFLILDLNQRSKSPNRLVGWSIHRERKKLSASFGSSRHIIYNMIFNVVWDSGKG